MTGNRSEPVVDGKLKSQKKRSSFTAIFTKKTPPAAAIKKMSTSASSLDEKEYKRRSLVSRLTCLVGRPKSDEKKYNKAETIIQQAATEKYKVLLLGAGECGKSTILRQIKVIHNINFNEEELDEIGCNLRRNTLQSMQVLIDACNYMVPRTNIEQNLLLKPIHRLGVRTQLSTQIEKPPRAFEVVDVGGQRNERRKWVECFANINCLMFVVNPAGYATVTYEDASMNRMAEAMNAFKVTVNNKVFNDTKICLVFNKKDTFENMLLKKPLKGTFPDYEGSNSPEECMQYIEGRFRTLLNNKPERLTTHHIAARQKEDVRELWETIVDEAKAAVSKQQTLEGGTESAIAPSGSEAGVKKQLSLTPEETKSQLKLGMEAQSEVKECVAENAVGGN